MSGEGSGVRLAAVITGVSTIVAAIIGLVGVLVTRGDHQKETSETTASTGVGGASSAPASSPPSAVTSEVSVAPPAVSTSAQATTEVGAPSPGSQLGRYTVKLPNGYGFSVTPKPPTQDDLGLAPQEVWYNARIYPNLGAKMVAPDGGRLSYDTCKASTEFVDASDNLARGVKFCVLVADTIAGFEVLDRDANAPPYTVTLQVTVWQR